LNGMQTGVSVPGGVFYRDVPPGTYIIAPWSQGDFPNAAKTVVLRSGDTFYAKVLSLRAWQSGGGTRFQRDTFIVVLIDPAQAQRELANMRYVQPLTGAALHAAPSVAPRADAPDSARGVAMRRIAQHLLPLLLISLANCAGARGPLYPEMASTIPPLAADRARIYFYRDYEPYESLSQASLYLNGAPVGVSVSGGFFYRDVTPATYAIAVWTQKDLPDASKTARLRAGDTIYAKVESFRGWEDGGGDSNFARDTFIVRLIEPVQAQRELARMHYIPPEKTVVRPTGSAAGAQPPWRGSPG
jgi:Protein of unknown function (DUF2846)